MQQFALQVQRQIPYFIQKDGSAISQFKLSRLAVFAGARKSTFFITKKFAFDKFIGNGGAGNADKGLARIISGIVNCLGEKLLASAAFPKNDDT